MSCAALVSLIVLASFGHNVSTNDAELRRIDAIHPEDPCSKAGGICTIAADCPEGHLSEKRGLCPQQQSQGIECCHGISMKETRCEKRGGVCMPPENYCNPQLMSREAHDCIGDTRCCILT